MGNTIHNLRVMPYTMLSPCVGLLGPSLQVVLVEGGVHPQDWGYLMKLGVVSPQVLFRKSLCAFLTAAGMCADVIEFDSVSDLVDRGDKSQSLVLIIYTADPAAGI
jgi:hypothetical protein